MRYVNAIFYKTMGMFALLLCAGGFLLFTTPGADAFINVVRFILPGQLRIQHVSGNVITGLSVTELTYVDRTTRLHLLHADARWVMTMHPLDLRLQLDHVQVQYKDRLVGLQGHGQLFAPFAVFATLHIDPMIPSAGGLRGHLNMTGDRRCYRLSGQFAGALPTPIAMVGHLNQLSELNTTLSIGPNRLTLSGVLPNEWQLSALIPEPQALHPALRGLTTTIEANGTFQGLKQGQLHINIRPGRFQSAEVPSMQPLLFQGGELSIDLTPDALNATGAFALDANEPLKMSLQLPQFDWQQFASFTHKMNGQLDFQVKSLDFLQALSPMIYQPKGQLSAQLKASGVLAHPDLQGTLTLRNASVSFPEAGVVLRSIQATLHSHNQHWEGSGSIVEQDGHQLILTGQGEIAPQLMGSVLVNGDHFPILKTAEYAIQASPQLTVQIHPNALDITGTFGIPSARFKPMVFSNTLNVTGDAVFVEETQTSTSKMLPITADVRVQLGDDVLIDTQGLHGLLGGALEMKQSLERSLSAIGELTIREGHYRAYGQDLAIDHGQLLFTGGALSNPNISLRAVKSFNNAAQFAGSNQLFDFNASNIQPIAFANHVTVGIDVSGYLNAPKIKLFAVPSSVSQADILSMLILGKPANQASQSGGKLLLTAMSAMNLDSGTKGLQLLSQLKEALGFDFDVQSRAATSSQSTSSTTFVVGKSLSKRLYLSYNVGVLQENSNVLTLKYLLNRYFSVQLSTNNVGNGVDLLYTASP